MRRKTLKNFRLFPLTLCFLFLFFCWGCRRQTETGTNGPDPKSQALNQVVNTYFSSAIASQYLNTPGLSLGEGTEEPSDEEQKQAGQVPDYLRNALEGYASESFMEQFFSSFPAEILSLCEENDYFVSSHSASIHEDYESFTCTLENKKGAETFHLKGTVQYDNEAQVTWLQFDNLDEFPGLQTDSH